MRRTIWLICVVLLIGCNGLHPGTIPSPQIISRPTFQGSATASCTPSIVPPQTSKPGAVGTIETGSTPTRIPQGSSCSIPAFATIHSLAEGDDLSGEYSFIDSLHGWAVTKTRLLATTDGGKSWKKILSWELPNLDIGGPDPTLYRINFISALEGFAYQDGKLVHTLDSGSTWSALPDPAPGERLFSIEFINSMDGWVLAEVIGLLRSRDGGKSWQPLKGPCPPNGYPYQKSFNFVNASVGWSTCTTENSKTGTIDIRLFRTPDGGDNWEQIEVNAPASPPGIGQGMPGWIPNIADGMDVPAFFDYEHGWTAGSGVLFSSKDGGKYWQPLAPEGITSYISNPEFVEANTGFAIASQGVAETGVALIKTTDGGRTWTQILPPLYPLLTSYLDTRTGFGVGSNSGTGLVYHTSDSGQTWQLVGSLPVDVISPQRIQFVDAVHGWILAQDCPDPKNQTDCFENGIYQTDDGGKTWQRHLNIGLDAISTFSMVDALHGYATTAVALRYMVTSDGLKSKQPASNQLGNIGLTQFQFLTAQTGYELIDGQLSVTQDGNHTWQAVNAGCSLKTFSLAQDGSLWALTTNECENCQASGGTIITSRNGGQTWQSIFIPGLWVMSIQFVDARHGWLTGGEHTWYGSGYTFNADHIYYTSDGGQTWTQFN